MAHTKILLVEDDDKLGRQVVEHLRSAGFEAVWIQDGKRALEVDPSDYALAVLDLMLPGSYGLDILKHWRSRSDVPVIVLSAQTDTHVKVRALELGGDDYVTKPFWPEELLARVHARLRRPLAQRDGRIEAGGLVLDLEARRLLLDGAHVELTRLEFDLLASLARRRGGAVQRSWLADHVLDPEREGTERTLDVHVSRLRKKLGTYAPCIATVWGVGYRFDQNTIDGASAP